MGRRGEPGGWRGRRAGMGSRRLRVSMQGGGRSEEISAGSAEKMPAGGAGEMM